MAETKPLKTLANATVLLPVNLLLYAGNTAGETARWAKSQDDPLTLGLITFSSLVFLGLGFGAMHNHELGWQIPLGIGAVAGTYPAWGVLSSALFAVRTFTPITDRFGETGIQERHRREMLRDRRRSLMQLLD